LRQLRWELSQLGVPNALLWQDRSHIEPGDIWSEAIFKALNNAELFVAILSCNYITSDWCKTELGTMASRVAKLDAASGQRRIFRVDKNSVPEDDIPETLRRIQAVQFYSEGDEDDGIDEFYWRGKVRRTREYEDAVNRLAKAIRKRLKELGIPLETPVKSKARSSAARPKKGAVFLAKPATDMLEAYRALVCELQGRGYRVTPDADKDLSEVGEEVQSTVVNALEDAEASIHLLGQRKGGRPDGLDMDLVPMQLAAAAEEARKKPDFVRMIWAPKVLMSQARCAAIRAGRKKISVWTPRGDQMVRDKGETASRAGFAHADAEPLSFCRCTRN
jgi:TIR domain